MRYGTDDDDELPNPNGCRWCGIDRQEHYQQWVADAGLHKWVEPTSEQRKERILARRARRLRRLTGQVSEPSEDVPKSFGDFLRVVQA